MRILILSTYFPPRNSMASHRPYSWAKYWSQAGHDVTVVSAKQSPAFDDLNVDLSTFKLIEVPWLPEFIQRLASRRDSTGPNKGQKAGLFQRILRLPLALIGRFISFLQNRYGVFFAQRFPDVFFLWRFLAQRRLREEAPWDVVVSSHGPYATHLLACRQKNQGRATTWIADYRDLWTDHHVYPGLWPFTLYERVLEKRLLTMADALTTVSNPLAEALRRRYPNCVVQTVENGFETSDVAQLPQAECFPEDNVVRIVYTGWIQASVRDPRPLFKAIAKVHRDRQNDSTSAAVVLNLEVLFVGPQSDEVQRMAQEHGVEQYVHQLGFRRRDECLHIQRDADVLLLLEFQSENHKGLLSGKIFEYLFSGTEIWAIGRQADDSVEQMLERSKSGRHFATDVDLIASALSDLLENKSVAQIHPDSDYLSLFTRESRAYAMLHIILNAHA